MAKLSSQFNINWLEIMTVSECLQSGAHHSYLGIYAPETVLCLFSLLYKIGRTNLFVDSEKSEPSPEEVPLQLEY